MAGETIFLIEDSNAVALGIQYALEMEGYQIVRSATAADARHLAQHGDFHLIILDIRLPDGSGFDLCRDFRADHIYQPIIFLTARDETIDKVIGLELGADDYLTKPFELQELIARIRSLVRRSYGVLTEAGQRRLYLGYLSLDLPKQQVTRGTKVIHLTATEFKLLAFLAQNPDKIFNRETLIDKVWDYEILSGDVRTVDVHIRNLRQKIEVDPSCPRTILTVRGSGYMLSL